MQTNMLNVVFDSYLYHICLLSNLCFRPVLNAQLSGMSLTGLAAGPIIGFSANPRTILKFKNKLALAHPHYVCEQVKKAIEVILITKK